MIKKILLLVLLLSLPLLAMIDNKPWGLMQIYVASPNLGIAISLNGYVGIGTTVPSSRLTVQGTDATTALRILNEAGASRFALNTVSDGSWTLYDWAGGSAKAGITQQSGNVGIGTASPVVALDVNGGIKVGNVSDCTAAKAGTIRWSGQHFEGCTGTVWKQMEYTAPPLIGSITPAFGSGSTVITITGSGFASGAQVTIGGVVATNVTWVSATQITATTPANTTGGAKDVIVTNLDSGVAVKGSGFTYIVLATGGTITTSGVYRIHTFTSSGTFSATTGGNVEVLVVGGGGGGGSDMGGGGGGGGVITNFGYTVTAQTYSITVGLGGSGAPAGVGQARGTNGGNSVFGSLTAIGGGGGGSEYGTASAPAGSGGSGGGTAGCNNGSPGTGTTGQGYSGGPNGGCYYPSGGGGAGGCGATAPATGGAGVLSAISGTNYYWGGGGGGSGYSTIGGNGGIGGGGGGGVGTTTGGAGFNNGSSGGGGSTVAQCNTPGGNAGANTGGGGGGGSHYNSNNYGGTGGSGIVIIRYPISQ